MIILTRRTGLASALVVVALGVVLPLLGGCKAGRLTPDKPAVMSSTSGSLLPYTIAEYTKDKQLYDDHVQAAKYTEAKVYRDIMINRIRADIRDNCGQFEDNLRQYVAEWGTGADFVELGLAAATSITGGAQSKTVLAAILTAVKGGRISVDKNFFREKTSEAIIAALRTSRLKADTAIVAKMSSLGVEDYTFEEAWNDLVDLYYAGTLASGFQTLAEQAGAKAEEARQEQEQLNELRAPILKASKQDIDLIGRLYAALATMTDDQARAILTQLGVPPTDRPKIALQAELRRLPPGDERFPDFQRAYDQALGAGKW